eukprot:CAMPEP_0181439744 /NCGR_PEP_ID=MMETSP1110-20121109/22593_1 /TAXON_ID=174948 /ORGANISM="Symbiodinium sp., Strain CCMP421" /LENGTH=49 /DNA_ID=CAMNT_0023563493 /DNA_START=12 /DNA_END=161 /DNA_ORIENTATION=-
MALAQAACAARTSSWETAGAPPVAEAGPELNGTDEWWRKMRTFPSAFFL